MFKYTINKDTEKEELLSFETSKRVFYPTDTSILLVDAVKAVISSPKRILDIGCGCGIVGIILAKCGLARGSVFASDISNQAITLAKTNAHNMSIEYEARCGSLFDPWEDEKFDLIVDDVAGVADDLAEASNWYPPGVNCNAGTDGTKWITKLIHQSKDRLTENGRLIFPVLSLSNEDKILEVVKKQFKSYELISQQDWFLPDEIAKDEEMLESLINNGSISCKKKFGKWIWSTYIYMANN